MLFRKESPATTTYQRSAGLRILEKVESDEPVFDNNYWSACPFCLKNQAQLKQSISAEYINNLYQTYKSFTKNKAESKTQKEESSTAVLPTALVRIYPNLESLEKFQYIC